MGPYAWIVDGVIVLAGPLPDHLANVSVAEREAVGWFLIDVTTNPRPPDTTTTTWSSGFVVINGRPVEQWAEVAKSAKQIEDEARGATRDATRIAVHDAFTRLTQIANYVPPTITNGNVNAQVTLTMAAVRDMAIYLRGLARLTLGGDLLDGG
jgi:hypothetical protein